MAGNTASPQADPLEGRPIRWGFIGAGSIAHTMADTIAASADQHGADAAYDSYAALVEDPDVDAVYISTTHPFHQDNALLASLPASPHSARNRSRSMLLKPMRCSRRRATEGSCRWRRCGCGASR